MRIAWILVVLACGCTERSTTVSNARLQPGDHIRPEIAFAPNAPWQTGSKITIGVLAKIERPAGDAVYLRDEQVPLEQVIVTARLTFWAGEQLLPEQNEVDLVHDC